jgi:signal transduction histidine kinase
MRASPIGNPAVAPTERPIRLFIELLVFVAAESTLIFDSADLSPAFRVGAPLLVLCFALLGLPVFRTSKRRATVTALVEIAMLLALPALHTRMPTLTFLVVASAFRTGTTLSGRRWVLLVAAECGLLVGALIVFPHQGNGDQSRGHVIETAAYAILALALVLAAIRYANSARSAFDALSVAHAELQQNVLRIGELATLRERERIALDLHDGLGHNMTSLTMQIEAARTIVGADQEAAGAYLSRAHAMSLEVLSAVRRSVHEIGSDPLERDALDVAIPHVCEQFALASGAAVAIDVRAMPSFDPSTTTHIVNIVREALTNIAKHAAATHIAVHAAAEPDGVLVTIDDNGRGFTPGLNESGHGLRGMRSRAQAIGAKIQIESALGSGCRVRLAVPVAQPVLAP